MCGASQPPTPTFKQRLVFAGQVLLFVICVVQFAMLYRSYLVGAAACAVVDAAAVRRQGASSESGLPSGVPAGLEQPFQTKPELFPGVYLPLIAMATERVLMDV